MANRKNNNYNGWHSLTDIAVASMNKGVFLPFSITLFLCFSIFRMPSEDVSNFLFKIIDDLKSGYLFGYLLFFVALLLWYKHVKALRKIAEDEVARIGEEKTEWQTRSLPDSIRSSEL